MKREKEQMTLASLLKLLADDNRLAIVELLRGRAELNVGEFCEMLAQSQPAVSHHLAQLRRAGLLETRRSGKHRYYRIRRRAWRDVELLLGSLIFEPAVAGPSRIQPASSMGESPNWAAARTT
jgi:DNA-binding transcriptional ArsR family regulator